LIRPIEVHSVGSPREGRLTRVAMIRRVEAAYAAGLITDQKAIRWVERIYGDNERAKITCWRRLLRLSPSEVWPGGYVTERIATLSYRESS
jgi:hypothetical protein